MQSTFKELLAETDSGDKMNVMSQFKKVQTKTQTELSNEGIVSQNQVLTKLEPLSVLEAQLHENF